MESLENTMFKNKMYIEKNNRLETIGNAGFEISMYGEIKNKNVHGNFQASNFNCFFYFKINLYEQIHTKKSLN